MDTRHRDWNETWRRGRFVYDDLIEHTMSHDLAEWLVTNEDLDLRDRILTGAEFEDAQTIGRAVYCMSLSKLLRRIDAEFDGEIFRRAVRARCSAFAAVDLAKKMARVLARA